MKIISTILGNDELKIVQDSDCFMCSLDSILLANTVTVNKKDKTLVDFGCGNAPIPLILAKHTNLKIYGIEISEHIYKLALETVHINNLENVTLYNENIKNVSSIFKTKDVDIVTTNPPYFKVHDNSRVNENDYKAYARHEVLINLEEIIKSAADILKYHGTLYIVHRPERIEEIMSYLDKYNFSAKSMQLFYPRPKENAYMVIIKAVHYGNKGLKVLNPIYVHNIDGTYTEELLEYIRK